MPEFELVLFARDSEFLTEAVQAGIPSVIVDLESKGKQSRQAGYDTEIDPFTTSDIIKVREWTSAWLLCRINGFGSQTQDEIEASIEGGADEILLPMVRELAEIDQTLAWVRGRCRVGILIETMQAVEIAKQLAKRSLSRVFFGLNDFAIERGSQNIFQAVVDGTVERIRNHFDIPFGFGGITLPDKGYPIPCKLLITAMVRMQCDFSFLRRSFYRDMEGKDFTVEVPRIYQSINEARDLSAIQLDREHNELVRTINKLVNESI